MLIKSLSRQAPSFGQLLHYLTRDDRPAGEPLRHNLITPDGRDLDLNRGLWPASVARPRPAVVTPLPLQTV